MKLGEVKRRLAERSLKRMLGGSPPPSLPRSSVRVLQVLRDPEVSSDEIGEALEWDPTLTVKLLGTVNSAAFAPRHEIHDVRHAITYLGRAQLESLVLAVVAQRASSDALPRSIDGAHFWYVAARRAAAARALGEALDPGHAGAAFTATLLADFAIPVLAAEFGERYADFAAGWETHDGAAAVELEHAALGVDHARAGGMLARSWGLPNEIAAAIETHHGEPESVDTASIVQLAARAPARGDGAEWIEWVAEGTGIETARVADDWAASHAQADELARALV